MNYIVKALIPEIPNSRKEFTKPFHYVEKITSETGIIVTGLSKGDIKTNDLISNDLIIMHNAYPISCFAAGMARAVKIPVIGFISSSRIVRNRDYVYISDLIVEGAEELTKILLYFLDKGELRGCPKR